MAGLVMACGSERSAPPYEAPGAGLVFSFPGNGQLDVPTGTLVSLLFSEAVVESEISPSCSVSANTVTGGVCLLGPSGPVAGSWSLVGETQSAVEFTPAAPLQANQGYSVHISPSLLASGVGNLASESAAVEFTTRGDATVAGTSAQVVAINGETPDVFGATALAKFPLVDFATFRLVFSEPMDERSAVLGASVEFVEITAGGGELAVPGQLMGQGVHMSFDPDEDLNATSRYEMRIHPTLLDLGGEAAAEASYSFAPVSSAASGELFSQVLDVAPGIGDENFPAASSLAALALNQVSISSGVIGNNIVELRDGKLKAELAHPNQFTTAMPLVIRKGQVLVSSGLNVELAGVVNSGLATGDLQLSFVSDLTGVLVRNEYWPSDTIPDNLQSPLQIALSFDLALSAVDPIGNAALTQTVYGVQAVGTASVVDQQLLISTISTIEIDVLGVAKANTRIVLAFSTTLGEAVPFDTTPPTLIAAYPNNATELLETGDAITLSFSEGVQLRDEEAVVLQTASGAAVPADIRAQGSMIVVTPSAALTPDQDFRVFVGGGLLDLSGNSWTSESGDPTGGLGVLDFSTAALGAVSPLPPAILASYPGAPCSLVGDTVGDRHCRGGLGGDDDYSSFSLPSNHSIDVVFDQPMRRDGALLGSACDQGAVRVEVVSGASCDSVVPGTLFVGQRSLQFVPNEPWTEGATYRLRLVGGGNNSCDSGELCGANGRPLNTDVLNSTEDSGGPDVEIFFSGDAASEATAVLVGSQPIVDRNGNGKVDSGETIADTNRAAVSIVGVGGIVSSASLDMPDCDADTPETEGCLYLSSDLVVRLEKEQSSCSITTAAGSENYDNCIPVTISPGAIYTTELIMDSSVLGLGLINDLSTAKKVFRMREPGEPARGYIVENANGDPEMIATLSTYMDAPDLSILGGLASHDIESKPLELKLRGPVQFRSDGRMAIRLRNEELIPLDVNVSSLGLSGTISLEIAPQAMVLDLVSKSARGGLR